MLKGFTENQILSRIRTQRRALLAVQEVKNIICTTDWFTFTEVKL